jgi:hypothetical protein
MQDRLLGDTCAICGGPNKNRDQELIAAVKRLNLDEMYLAPPSPGFSASIKRRIYQHPVNQKIYDALHNKAICPDCQTRRRSVTCC